MFKYSLCATLVIKMRVFEAVEVEIWRLNWDGTGNIRYGIVYYGVLSPESRTSGQATRFEPAYANMRTLSI